MDSVGAPKPRPPPPAPSELPLCSAYIQQSRARLDQRILCTDFAIMLCIQQSAAPSLSPPWKHHRPHPPRSYANGHPWPAASSTSPAFSPRPTTHSCRPTLYARLDDGRYPTPTRASSVLRGLRPRRAEVICTRGWNAGARRPTRTELSTPELKRQRHPEEAVAPWRINYEL